MCRLGVVSSIPGWDMRNRCETRSRKTRVISSYMIMFPRHGEITVISKSSVVASDISRITTITNYGDMTFTLGLIQRHRIGEAKSHGRSIFMALGVRTGVSSPDKRSLNFSRDPNTPAIYRPTCSHPPVSLNLGPMTWSRHVQFEFSGVMINLWHLTHDRLVLYHAPVAQQKQETAGRIDRPHRRGLRGHQLHHQAAHREAGTEARGGTS